jgi:hypothetical protein
MPARRKNSEVPSSWSTIDNTSRDLDARRRSVSVTAATQRPANGFRTVKLSIIRPSCRSSE